MAVYKDDKRGTWFVQCAITDSFGKRTRKTKRGFATKREALDWEQDFKAQSKNSLSMTLGSFYELYTADKKPRVRESTWANKTNIIEKHILPYFKDVPMNEITPPDVLRWENELIEHEDAMGDTFAPTYLRSICNQLNAIFNHAVRYYGLRENPVARAGKMGAKKSGEMLYWTKQEYLRFSDAIMSHPLSFTAFEVLYWCGIREGEMMALTPSDFDFDKLKLRINKTYQRVNGKELVTDPKTKKSVRTISLPSFLADEVKTYLQGHPEIGSNDRAFPISKSALRYEMDRGTERACVKRIRVHDLRHSHVSLLIEMGFSVLAIAERLGHEGTEITFRYAHLFPNTQDEMAERLDAERGA